MEERLKALNESLSLTAAEMLMDELAEIDNQTEITDDARQRILSSVMRKAGFEMKETISAKRTKKRTVTIAVIVAAAVCLCSFTVYVVYQYNYGNAFKSKLSDNGKAVTGDVHELESTTQPFDGVVLENTFTNIDFTVEGVVSDAARDVVIVTARKTDGTSFAEGDEELFDAGLQMSIPSNIEYFDGREINDSSELYWGGQSVNCELNDDGTLSLTMVNDWKIGEEEYDIILGFGDLFSYHDSNETEKQYTDFINSFNNLDNLSVYNGSEDIKDYSGKLDIHKQLYRDFSDDLYEGHYIIKAHISANDYIISPEENDCGMKIVLSGMTCTISGDGNSFLEFAGITPDNDGYGETEITFKSDNGGEFTETVSFAITEHSYMTESGVMNDPEVDSSTVWIYSNLSRFTDPYKINEILINGKTLWKR